MYPSEKTVSVEPFKSARAPRDAGGPARPLHNRYYTMVTVTVWILKIAGIDPP